MVGATHESNCDSVELDQASNCKPHWISVRITENKSQNENQFQKLNMTKSQHRFNTQSYEEQIFHRNKEMKAAQLQLSDRLL